jgi:hypothetical protein
MLATSGHNGVTQALLSAHGFDASLIAKLVNRGRWRELRFTAPHYFGATEGEASTDVVDPTSLPGAGCQPGGTLHQQYEYRQIGTYCPSASFLAPRQFSA